MKKVVKKEVTKKDIAKATAERVLRHIEKIKIINPQRDIRLEQDNENEQTFSDH